MLPKEKDKATRAVKNYDFRISMQRLTAKLCGYGIKLATKCCWRIS